MRILVAEDDDNSRELLEAVLSAEGHEVASFDNGLKAFAHLQTQPADFRKYSFYFLYRYLHI
jgi:DNA-binding response OmpR family regulator